MRPLYGLTQDMLALNDLLDQAGAELDAELALWFDRVAAEQPRLLDDLLDLAAEKAMRATAAKAEADQWAERAKREQRGADAVRRRILAHLVATGQTAAETASGRVLRVVPNGGARSVLLADEFDPAQLPDDLVRVRREPDRAAIAAALERGERVPGCAMVERGQHLRVS